MANINNHVPTVKPVQPVAKAEPKTIILNEEHIRQIQNILGGMLKDGADLVQRLTRNQQINLGDGIDIVLSPEDLWVMKQQSIGMSREYREYVASTVEEALGYHLNGFFTPRHK